MIYKNLQHLTALADDLIAYVESDSEANKKSEVFMAITFLFHIEELFDLAGRGLFKDEDGFEKECVGEAAYLEAHNTIQASMDRIRSKMEQLVNTYGKEEFKKQYASLRAEEWIRRM